MDVTDTESKGMTTMLKPHDTTDLLLSPVAIEINARIDELAALDPRELCRRVTWETNMEPRTPQDAAEALVRSLTYLIDTHGWQVSWDARGIRLHHGEYGVVLGVSPNLVEYVNSGGHPVRAA
ncbi:hypothetical protein GCM10009547_25310 [Sporichthya brevicatena]|uniref:Uncharacterized protein n=1 Tax=Sporichthya brevicatena TaxID=171442 RepID=A0ABN1GW62_9ACTN